MGIVTTGTRGGADGGGRPRHGFAGWTALGCWVHLVVTDPAALGTARSMLAADLADLDAACSRFRADSELVALDHADGRRSGSARCSPAPWPWRCARPN